MTQLRSRRTAPLPTQLRYGFSIATVLAMLLMLIPVHSALAAGLASVSLLLFGALGFVAGILIITGPNRTNWALTLALIASLIGCLLPQASFVQVAHRHQTTLSFNPLTYVHFSGATELHATAIYVYKHADNHQLRIAYYRAKQPGTRPLVVLLHGGAWRYGDYLETGVWPSLLTAAGYSVASVDYRLASNDRPTWQEAPADVHDALSYLAAHATELSVDQSQIHLLGQSAGGHLALLEAYRHHQVASVISLYAPVDPALDYATSRDKTAELDFIGGPPVQYRQRYLAVSPIAALTAAAPRSLVIQGEFDDLVATQNASMLLEALQNHNVPHEALYLPMTGHSFENQQGGFATQITEQKVLHFLQRR